jgi:uncharacterized protein
MRDERFEWDDVKALRNERKHGVTFYEAREVFGDLNALIELDEEVAEERWRHIGVTASGLLFVVATERGQRTRIIMARRADSNEQDSYRRQTTPRR